MQKMNVCDKKTVTGIMEAAGMLPRRWFFLPRFLGKRKIVNAFPLRNNLTGNSFRFCIIWQKIDFWSLSNYVHHLVVLKIFRFIWEKQTELHFIKWNFIIDLISWMIIIINYKYNNQLNCQFKPQLTYFYYDKKWWWL